MAFNNRFGRMRYDFEGDPSCGQLTAAQGTPVTVLEIVDEEWLAPTKLKRRMQEKHGEEEEQEVQITLRFLLPRAPTHVPSFLLILFLSYRLRCATGSGTSGLVPKSYVDLTGGVGSPTTSAPVLVD
mgnify:CR=1 FL=1